ncbi:MAG: hypothetical protein H6654_06390 [Ardenticatenaceae bacterium]|nr:hypothetical protein [Anaerolineales bacterium]MCB8942073.1 hypothetical protein [Ardenticatenaceae bacterium]MCB8973167.1 hypothetical protein [Ardenticatenaceae bacterium]
MLKNGTFTEGWMDMPPYGNLINQQPNGWILRWIEPGSSLFGAGDQAAGVPECVHKLAKQLPANEQLGAKDALILAGDTTYKIFHAGSPFGAELKQVVTGLKPGSKATLLVPILAVLHNESDPYGAESGVWINGQGEWVNGGQMGNRKWHYHEQMFTVPNNGTAIIEIRVKSKWARPKDFFIDGITLQAEADGPKPVILPDPIMIPDRDKETAVPTTTPSKTVKVQLPKGMKLVTAVSDDPNTVVIVLPKGVVVQKI